MGKKVTGVLALLALALVGLGFFGRLPGLAARPNSGPDVGGKIAYIQNGSLWVYEGGNSRRLTDVPEDRFDKHAAFPSVSSDGINIVFSLLDEGYSDLYKLDVEYPDELEQLTRNKPKAETGGQGYTDQALWAIHSAYSPDGARIAFTSDVGTQYPRLYIANANGKNPQPFGRLDYSSQTVERPTWSPDGTRIALTNFIGTPGGKGQIWTLNVNTGRWTEITNAEDGAYDPAWSLDGNWIAFTMRRGNAHNIYAVPTDATQWTEKHPTPIQITTIDSNARTPVWSPDGVSIAYLSLRDGSFDLYTGVIEYDSVTGNPRLGPVSRLTENAHLDGAGGLSWGP